MTDYLRIKLTPEAHAALVALCTLKGIPTKHIVPQLIREALAKAQAEDTLATSRPRPFTKVSIKDASLRFICGGEVYGPYQSGAGTAITRMCCRTLPDWQWVPSGEPAPDNVLAALKAGQVEIFDRACHWHMVEVVA